MTDINIDAKNEIKEVLRKFQEGYTKRDKSILDGYMEELFAKGKDTVVLGTSSGELCLGFEGAREIVESDWEYWGDVAIDTDSPEITVKGDTAWLAVSGTVKYVFEDSEERYGRYVNAVKRYFDAESEESRLDTGSKLAYINWLLTYTVFNRPSGKRVYQWPIRITSVLIRQAGKWKFKYMQFSLPVPSEYPDVRYDRTGAHQAEHSDSVKIAAQFAADCPCAEESGVRLVMDSFARELMDSPERLIDKYFSAEEYICIIGTGEAWHRGRRAATEALEQLRGQWKALELDAAFVGANGDTAWYTAIGRAIGHKDEEKAQEEAAQYIREVLETDIPSGDKLFRIQRGIALMLKGVSGGSTYEWPVRLESILVKQADRWVIHSMQFSYPFYFILEGKYDMTSYIAEE